MGEHDQTVLHGDDAHGNIHDDGRTLRPAGLYDPEVAAEDDGHNNIHFRDEVMPGPRLRMTPVFRYSHDELIPDILHVHLRPFSATEWESLYSTPFGTGTEPQLYHYPMWDATDPSFTPVIDESYRVVGHLGWISGEQICVPMFTVAAHSPSALVLEKARLGEDRQRLLSMYDRDPFPAFPARRARPEPDSEFWAAVRRGRLKDGSEEQRHQNNINYYLAGGGEALVGCEFAKELMASWKYESFSMNYRCLALVRPDGYLQGVLRVEKILHQTREQKEFNQLLEVIDIALTIWMIIDIATISVSLFRLGRLLARAVEIRALKLAVDQGAKAALKLAEQEAKRALPKVLGRMAGPDAVKDAFWRAGVVTPRQFSEAEVKQWTAKIATRMKQLGIPEKNIGIKVRKYPPGKPKKMIGTSDIPGESGEAFNPRGMERGSNLRTVADQYGVEEGGISVHGSVFERWEGFDLWNAASTRYEDRIDAIIAHEWMEFNELSHWETVELIEQSKLRISQTAKELLRHMKTQGKPLKALTEFPKPK